MRFAYEAWLEIITICKEEGQGVFIKNGQRISIGYMRVRIIFNEDRETDPEGEQTETNAKFSNITIRAATDGRSYFIKDEDNYKNS